MKRSEMVINIAIELMSRLPEWEKQERLNFASEILQCVEIEGMLPPPTGIEYGVTSRLCYVGYDYLDMDDSKPNSLWEPEDE